jgi:hypothetical protein
MKVKKTATVDPQHGQSQRITSTPTHTYYFLRMETTMVEGRVRHGAVQSRKVME